MPREDLNLTDHHSDFIRQSIEDGDYQDLSEVVRAGLRLLEEWRIEKLRKEAKLRTMLEEAKAGGVSDRTPREVWAAVEARYRREDA